MSSQSTLDAEVAASMKTVEDLNAGTCLVFQVSRVRVSGIKVDGPMSGSTKSSVLVQENCRA